MDCVNIEQAQEIGRLVELLKKQRMDLNIAPTEWRLIPEGVLFAAVAILGQLSIDKLFDLVLNKLTWLNVQKIPPSGTQLTTLSAKDRSFIYFNRGITCK